MANNKKLILVGPINMGKVPSTGDTMKNQLFLKRFRELFEKVIPIDTNRWKERPWVLIKLVFTIALNPDANVVLSANPGSADVIIKLLRKLHIKTNLFYWVVGGSLHTRIKNGIYDAENYKWVKALLVQGQSMVELLRESGLNNVFYVANSKYIEYIPEQLEKKDHIMHFVFLSRLERYKGCDDIIDAAQILNTSGYEGLFDITFYGKTTDELGYDKAFREKIASHQEITYKGLLNLRDTKNYSELARYDVMLFPTFWEGEGFPGVVIDAYIAGLPIIASNWNLNKDVIVEDKTGWLIPPHDIIALADKMRFVIDNPSKVAEMSKNSTALAMRYDARNVLSENKLKEIGLLC